MYYQKKNIILEKKIDFAPEMIQHCELPESERKDVLTHQISKSGTSIGANIREAQHAASRNDFIHKIKQPLKKPMKAIIGWHCVKNLFLIPPIKN